MSDSINGFPVVDETYRPGFGPGNGTGYIPRDFASYPIAGLKCARAFSEPLLDKQTILEMIDEKTAAKSWISDLCDKAGLEVKDQSQSSYCWIHAPTHEIEINRVLGGGTKLVLSAFYPGSQIKNGRNEGGSGIEGIEWMAERGTCLESMWEPMKFRGTVTPEIVANAALHKILAFDDIDASNHQAIQTCICLNIPVTVGIPAWGHEITLTFLVRSGSNVVYGIDNSWGADWGNNGRGVLSASYSRFDEAGAVRVTGVSVV